jgi:hypothetical protein
MTGGTPLYEALWTKRGLVTRQRLTSLELWQRTLIGGGQGTLTVVGGITQLRHLKARLQGFREFHFTTHSRTTSIRQRGLFGRKYVYTTARPPATARGAVRALALYDNVPARLGPRTPNVMWRVRPPIGSLIKGPRPVKFGTGTEILRDWIPKNYLRGPFPLPSRNAMMLGAQGTSAIIVIVPDE